MPNFNAIQASFAGGEISPKLVGRVDSDLYKRSLRYCSDFEPLPYGSLKMRGGTRYQLTPGGLTSDCRIIEFPVAGKQSKSLVLGNKKVRVYDENGQVENGSIDLVKNGDFFTGFQHWTLNPYAPYSFIEGNRVFFRAYDFAFDTTFIGVKQQVPIDPGTYTLTVKAASVPKNLIRFRVGTTDGGGELLDQIATVNDEGAIPPNVNDAYEGSMQDYSYSFTVPGGTTLVYLDIRVRGIPNYASNFATPGGDMAGLEVKSISIPKAGTGGVEFVAPWEDTQLLDVQFVPDASIDRLIFVHPSVAPYELAYSQKSGLWTFSMMTFTQPPGGARWGTVDYGYPSAVEIYDGRLWFGGIPGRPNAIVASKAGNIDDFTVSSPVIASDAIDLKISTKGEIIWIQGARSLLVGTDKGEYSITGAPISALDFQAKPESAFGSSHIQAVVIGDQLIYFSRDRRKARALNFNLQENGFQSRDISFSGEHLTKNLVEEAAWAPDPNDTFVMLLRDGTLVACVYNRPEQVVAWYRMNVGVVYSIMAANGPLGSELRMLVQRGSDICLERLPMYEDELPFYFDSSVAAPISVDGKAFVGTRLAGETVGVCVNGSTVHPDRVVDENGYITDLEVTEGSVYAGLKFKPKARLLPVEGGGQKGTAQGAKRRRVRLYLKLNDSAVPLVNGERPFPDRSIITPLDTPEARTSGTVMTNLLGFEDEGGITIEQDIPMRTEILAVFGSVEVSES